MLLDSQHSSSPFWVLSLGRRANNERAIPTFCAPLPAPRLCPSSLCPVPSAGGPEVQPFLPWVACFPLLCSLDGLQTLAWWPQRGCCVPGLVDLSPVNTKHRDWLASRARYKKYAKWEKPGSYLTSVLTLPSSRAQPFLTWSAYNHGRRSFSQPFAQTGFTKTLSEANPLPCSAELLTVKISGVPLNLPDSLPKLEERL